MHYFITIFSFACLKLFNQSCSVRPSQVAQSSVSTKKRGVAVAGDIFSPYNNLLKISSAAWFYGWEAIPIYSEEFIKVKDRLGEFVPMVWGSGNAGATLAARQAWVQSKVTEAIQYMNPNNKILLGFNEPDKEDQSNMTVEDALSLWPILMQSGARLGSPASADNPSKEGTWLMEFMQGIQAKNLRVDFICAHYYLSIFDNTTAAVEDLKGFLTNIYNTYQKPIWLTEFALMKFVWNSTTNQIDTFYPSLNGQAEFAKEAAKMLDSLDIVERYAWYKMNQGTAVPPENSYLIDNAGNLTPVGTAYNSQ